MQHVRHTLLRSREHGPLDASFRVVACAKCLSCTLLLAFVARIFFPAVWQWERVSAQHYTYYQLSDAVRWNWEEGGRTRARAQARFASNFPGSIVDDYLKRVNEHPSKKQLNAANFVVGNRKNEDPRPFDVELLEELVLRHAQPTNATLVVHLRLGDVLIKAKEPVDQLWNASGEGNWYVRNRRFYDCIAPQLTKSKFKRVVFLASNLHMRDLSQFFWITQLEPRSRRYKQLVDGWFKMHVPNAERWWRDSHLAPDTDFAYMSQARHFVPGGGGFAAAAAVLVKRAGGQVYEC